jgi:hypothetical protein
MWEPKWLGRSKGLCMKLALLPRYVTLTVALVLAVSCSSSTSRSGQASPTSRTVAQPTNVGVGGTVRRASTVVRHVRRAIGNGVGVVFSTTTSSRLIDGGRQRDEVLQADEKAAGQPIMPDYCMPEEAFTATFSVAGAHYVTDGAVSRGSGVPLRVIVYGEDKHFVYVLARSYDPGVTTIDIQLSHPALTGTMSSLGDRWFVFAAPVGTRAPWYVEGVLSASKTDGTRVTMSVPEVRLTPC